MKIDRHGKAKILSQEEIQLLFSEGLQTSRDRALQLTHQKLKVLKGKGLKSIWQFMTASLLPPPIGQRGNMGTHEGNL